MHLSGDFLRGMDYVETHGRASLQSHCVSLYNCQILNTIAVLQPDVARFQRDARTFQRDARTFQRDVGTFQRDARTFLRDVGRLLLDVGS